MNCNVVKDLIPLYIDGCCSEESKNIVNEHIHCCNGCKKLLEDMKAPSDVVVVSNEPIAFHKINNWKASILQSVLLFLSFALITIGVALEANTPIGWANGFWANTLVIPATGFMLSLANWYFVRIYKSKRGFSACSMIATLGITLFAFIWSGFHYEIFPYVFLSGLEALPFFLLLHYRGILITVVFCVLSKTFSNQYAEMLGKE